LAEEKESIYRELYKPYFKEVKGLKPFLDSISKKGLKTGVATTSPLSNRVFVLEALQLQDFFTIIVGAEHTKQGKPHPEIYLLAAEKLGVDPKKCLAFEDTLAGIKSAKSAGMTVTGVLTTHSKEELSEADYFIKDFTKIEV
jgi:beta-phosphoglucomutase